MDIINIFIYTILFFILYYFFYNIFKCNFIKKKPKTTKLNYSLFYADEKVKDKKVITCKILKSDKYRLKGKPDYILKHKYFNKYIPIELKSGSIKESSLPRENDLMQLITYFLIIEDIYNSRPKYGYLVYNDFMFIVKNTNTLRKNLINTTKNMEEMLVVGKSKNKPKITQSKCRLCKYRHNVCEFHKHEEW